MQKTMHAIRIHKTGNPDVMQLEELSIPKPGPDEALVAVKAAGINFIDIYIRSGSYERPLPFTLGFEGAGVVEAVGDNVTHVKPGDRVAWGDVVGSYATMVLANAERLVVLPDALSFEQGAAAMLQGMTAHYLIKGAYWLKKGDTCLVHAAAGGVGLLLCQLGKMLGARVIGTVSTPEKAQLARKAGADETILYTQEDFSEVVKTLTGGNGVNVVYDSVGKDTFTKSLAALGLRGYLVTFGQASGAIPPFDLKELSPKSLFITRPSLFNYVATRAELLQRVTEVFQWIMEGKLTLHISHQYALHQAVEAHQDLMGRKTTGKILLVP